MDFNPRSREGNDFALDMFDHFEQTFQSTFPRGERHPYANSFRCSFGYFNPRSREGNDGGITRTQNNAEISIHVPARGTTFAPVYFPAGSFFISIHVPARGTTVNNGANDGPFYRFQSTFPRGERPLPSGASKIARLFQSTFPRGERQADGYAKVINDLFQSTFPRGERHHSPIKFLIN